jgi:hypothetical protein
MALARACPGFITSRRRGFSLFYSRWRRSPRASWDGWGDGCSPSPRAFNICEQGLRACLECGHAFIRKWRLKCHAVAASLEEAGDKLFTFARFPKSRWKSIRTSNAVERLHEEFKRRIRTQTVLPSAETAAILFWALLASGQIAMGKVDGWQSLAEKPSDQIIDLAA